MSTLESMENHEIRVGEMVLKLRDEQDLSQMQLARLSGISHDTLSRIENLNRYPSEHTIRKLAEAFNVSVAYLFGEVKNPRRKRKTR